MFHEPSSTMNTSTFSPLQFKLGMTDFQGYAVLFLLGLIPALILRAIIKSLTPSKLQPPPGVPFRLPIIGHLHLLLTGLPCQALHKLSSKYGPLIYVYLGYNPYVIVSSPEMAEEVLKTNELAWSDRPQTGVSEYLSYDALALGFVPHGPYWKFMRKLTMTELLGSRALDLLHNHRHYEIESMINGFLKKARAEESVDVACELSRLSNNVISMMVLSRRCSESDDDTGEIKKLMHEVSEALGTFNLSDHIWFCRNLDLQGIKKKLANIRRRFDIIVENIIEERKHTRRMSKNQNGDGADRPKDFLDVLLDVKEDDNAEIKLSINNVKAMILDMFTAGTTTTSAAIEWAFAELINHPGIMAKARHEIDVVVGKSRLVQDSDIVNLPYLQAIVKEALRLHPAGPVIPRESNESCTIANYHIPAKTRLLVNVWALGRDPNTWENPLEFKPERFLSSEDGGSLKGQLDVRGQHFQVLPFGTGRRGCPGASLGLKVSYTALAAMIQCFEWNVVAGYQGLDGKLDMEARPAVTYSRAQPLICVPVARLNPFPSFQLHT